MREIRRTNGGDMSAWRDGRSSSVDEGVAMDRRRQAPLQAGTSGRSDRHVVATTPSLRS